MPNYPKTIVIILTLIEAYILSLTLPTFNQTHTLIRSLPPLILLNTIIYTILIHPFFISPLRHLPGPKGSILLGNALEASFSHPRGDKLREWMEEIPNDGLLRFREWFNRDAILVCSAETLKTCLNDCCYDYVKKPRVRDILARVLGEGLILVEGNVHRFQRKHLLPSFQVKVIRDLYPTFWTKACELTQLMHNTTTAPETEIGDWCTRVTLDIIGIAGFGRDFNTLANPHSDFVRDYHELLEPTGEKALFFGLNLVFPHWLINMIPFWRIPRDLNTISKNLYDFAYNLSRERRAELNNPLVSEEAKAARNDILSLLIKSDDFSDAELAHQVLTMMAAGHETTSSTLSWCLFLLAQNPAYQDQLRDEVRANLPSPRDPAGESTISAAQIDALPLLNSICNETLRLYPSVPTTTRNVARQTVLAGQVIPAGTSIFISLWGTNRLKKIWGPDALEFRPERWMDMKDGKVTLNNTGGSENNYDLMTFLHGPRSCIGQGFARSELKCILAAVVGRYSFEITRDPSTYYTAGLVTTKAANGMWLKVTEVPGW